MTTPAAGSFDLEWDVTLYWNDGIWRASAIGPKGAHRTVTVSVSGLSAEGARKLLRAMLWLIVGQVGRA